MKRLLLLLTLIGCVSTQPQTTFHETKLREIDAAVELAIANKKIPGGVFWIERDGVAVHRAYGNRALVPSVEAMSEETIVDAASLTKVTATAPAIWLLAERGKLSIDDPVARYIPGVDPEITIRHLLTHSSGLRPGLSLREPWSGYENGIELAVKETPVNRPGHIFRYSDVNYILLGEVVRVASGRPLHEFVREEIFQPLKMRDTGFLPKRSERIAPTELIPSPPTPVPADGGERDEKQLMLRGVVHD
ncbi:MAG TPA: serine hydrolase domain-containing protein, partial [Thermoanaerobaculia bacterium]